MDAPRLNKSQVPAFFEKEFLDKSGKLIIVKVFVYSSRNQNSIDSEPRISIHRKDISEVLQKAFKDKSQNVAKTINRIEWIENDNVIELLLRRDDNGIEKVIGLQSYIYDNLPGSLDIKFLYNHYSAIIPEEQSIGLRKQASLLILNQLTPEVISGSTHSISYYISSQNAGEEIGYNTYPRPGEIVPKEIFSLGKHVLEGVFGKKSVSSLDRRLVRTSTIFYSDDSNGREFLFFEKELALRAEQGVMCIAVRPDFAAQIGIQA